MYRIILKRLKNGDKDALKELFDQYYSPLTRYAIFHLNESHPAEEIVQDTFVYLWEKRAELIINSSLESYLYKSVRNKCLNYLKSRPRKMNQLSVSDSSLHNFAAASSDSLESSELHELLVSAVQELPQKTSVIFHFSRNSGLTHVQIADKLGISVKTVEYHIGSALKSIKGYLEKNGYQFSIIGMLIYFFFGDGFRG